MLNTKTFKLKGTCENSGYICVSLEHPLYEIKLNNKKNNAIFINKNYDKTEIFEYNYIVKILNKNYYIEDLIDVHGGIISTEYVGTLKYNINNRDKLNELKNIPDDWWAFGFKTKIPVLGPGDGLINEDNYDEEFLDKELKYFEEEINRVAELLLELKNTDSNEYKLSGKRNNKLNEDIFEPGDVVKHIKSGHNYVILHVGYRADTNMPYKSQIPQIIYTRQGIKNSEIWTRNLHQFKSKFKKETN